MAAERRVLIHRDKETLTDSVAERFLTKMVEILSEKDVAHVVLTGGGMGIGVLAAIDRSLKRNTVDWQRVHFWWGDERWLPKGDDERNDKQARDALLDSLIIPAGNIHPFPTSDNGADLDLAAEEYARALAGHAAEGLETPVFDITFLGVGPDGHIASLFPDREEIRAGDRTVVPVRNSPKPPPERLSLTLPVLNSSDRVWMVLAGADKASALGLALAGASRDEVPVAGVHGRKRTMFFVDESAAAEVPEELVAPSY
jgi:6-phosphogluconolactonase